MTNLIAKTITEKAHSLQHPTSVGGSRDHDFDVEIDDYFVSVSVDIECIDLSREPDDAEYAYRYLVHGFWNGEVNQDSTELQELLNKQ